MIRIRTVFLVVSLTVVMLFSGVLLASRNSQDALYRALGNLAEVVHLIESEYVDELNQEALALSLDAGLVESLERSAAVLPPDRIGDYLEFVEMPPAYGLGLSSRLGSAAVRYVLTGSPAEDAGLSDWEVIELVEGVNSRGRPMWQIRLELMDRQNQGLPVTLTVFDREVDERREVTLVPSEWQPQVATAELHDEGTVIRLETLPEGASTEIADLVPEDGRLVIDLRDLKWGLESAAIELADGFAEDGVLGQWVGRRAGSRTYEANPGRLIERRPVVIVGPETEGVGEVLASALKRHGAVVVGQQTAGRAAYMSLVRDGDLAIWMPVGQWLGADDEPIDGRGVEPDESVEGSTDDDPVDPVLRRALELVDGELEQAA
jgi:carboxyl-terminal processing protease